MVSAVKIKLTSPILGELKKDADAIRRFKRINDQIAICVPAWQEQFAIAAKMLQLPVNCATILPAKGYDSPSINLYRRIYSRVQVELFESIKKDCVLTVDFAVRTDLPKAPNEKQFADILNATGNFLGLSQFGSKFGFGRFEVLQIEKCNQEQNSSGVQENSS